MLYLGDWQLHRALSGNELSWAYTFEWPLFAIFGVYFWVKSLRDELRGAAGGDRTMRPGTGPSPAQSHLRPRPMRRACGPRFGPRPLARLRTATGHCAPGEPF